MPELRDIGPRPTRGSWLEDALPDHLQRCRQRILVVTDGLSFEATQIFGLTEFLAELGAMTPTPTITTRLRGAAAVPAFVFDATITTSNYDQVWLFGSTGTPLSASEIGVMWAFMEAGGGVFATGDHEDLGFALCGELPRVRKMRDWRTVPMVNERIDTLTNPGLDRTVQFDDQSDEFPQRIFPHYSASGSEWYPHPLLRSPLRDIDVLPDHPHESVCLSGSNLGDRYALHGMNLVEFPADGGSPLSPQIIASSVSAGRHIADRSKPPTTPRIFGAISVWDGHRVNKGRIVTDATWHHFVNLNLNGVGTTRPGLAGTDRLQIGRYYRNIATWLAPQARQMCHRYLSVIVERYAYPLFEEWPPQFPDPCPWKETVALGRRVEAALDANLGSGYTAELVNDALALSDGGGIAKMLQLRSTRDDGAMSNGTADLLIDVDELRAGIAARVFDAFVRDLPGSPHEVPAALEREHDDDRIVKAVAEAARAASEAAVDSFADRAKNTLEFINRGCCY